MFIICLIVFILEMIITFLTKENYAFGLFFWFDIISIVSIIPEVDWMILPIQKLFGFDRYDQSVDAIPGLDISHNSIGDDIQRVLKGFRITRLMRVIKLYKFCTRAKKEEKEGINVIFLH